MASKDPPQHPGAASGTVTAARADVSSLLDASAAAAAPAATVIPEEEFEAGLRSIIRRDFFPDRKAGEPPGRAGSAPGVDEFLSKYTTEDDASAAANIARHAESNPRRAWHGLDEDTSAGGIARRAALEAGAGATLGAKTKALLRGDTRSARDLALRDAVEAADDEADSGGGALVRRPMGQAAGDDERPAAPHTWRHRREASAGLLQPPRLEISNDVSRVPGKALESQQKRLLNEHARHGSALAAASDSRLALADRQVQEPAKTRLSHSATRLAEKSDDTATPKPAINGPHAGSAANGGHWRMVAAEPSPAPGTDATPLLTWGDVAATPVAVQDSVATPLPRPFTIAEESKRERAARAAEAAGRRRAAAIGGSTPGTASRTKVEKGRPLVEASPYVLGAAAAAMREVRVPAGTRQPTMSGAAARLTNMSPALRRLAAGAASGSNSLRIANRSRAATATSTRKRRRPAVVTPSPRPDSERGSRARRARVAADTSSSTVTDGLLKLQ